MWTRRNRRDAFRRDIPLELILYDTLYQKSNEVSVNTFIKVDQVCPLKCSPFIFESNVKEYGQELLAKVMP